MRRPPLEEVHPTYTVVLTALAASLNATVAAFAGSWWVRTWPGGSMGIYGRCLALKGSSISSAGGSNRLVKNAQTNNIGKYATAVAITSVSSRAPA